MRHFDFPHDQGRRREVRAKATHLTPNEFVAQRQVMTTAEVAPV
jgi:hypothetical protein